MFNAQIEASAASILYSLHSLVSEMNASLIFAVIKIMAKSSILENPWEFFPGVII